ncbi:MAG: hypothetical protein HWN67_15630 [Candidatus Helarchaeota archaeon]|nr:hypothetical protein [Candidatus Helarchaeota archaeon]
MAIDWWYSVQFYSNKIFGTSIINPVQLITLVSISVSGIFLIGIINALYTNYKKNKLIETLLFLVGMICLIIAAVFGILVSFAYRDWGLRGLGDLFSICMNILVLSCIILVNLFSIRVTFPKKYKFILAILLILTAILVYTGLWAALEGFPYTRVVDFVVVFSLEFMLIRFFGLLPFSIIPISLFFYYAKKVRNEQRAHSNRSIWLGLDIICFATAIMIANVIPRFQFIQVLLVPAAIIFYVCFSMPDWFKRKIGWID